MKKIQLISCLVMGCLVTLLIGNKIMAQTPSTSASSSPTMVVSKDIQQLKDKIASKVSEIRKKNNKAVSGFVVRNDGDKIKINNDGEENEIKFDNTLTKYFKILGTQKKEIKVDDIKKNDYVIVSGVVSDNMITANIVLIDDNFLADSGKITEINKDNYYVKVISSDKNTYSLDIEIYTKLFMVNIKTLDLERSEERRVGKECR